MRTTTIASCVLPGLLLGICFAASAAQRSTAVVDAKSGKLLRAPTAEERRDMAQAVAARQSTLKQPRTAAEAQRTLKGTPNGDGSTIQVPTELWTTLSATTDAQGKVSIREHDGEQAPATTDGGLEK
ncbi:hypothetical protein [Luteimonas gilva]|uniref:hypothetical protein n=1 Tax=Luteimonas gilva TaxID=2572684 RepID=UPI0016727A89|nr:hypothetical protein [Luteimonas gilva]